MPIPAVPNRPDAASTVLGLFHQVHDQIRGEISDLDDAGLNWLPSAGANSIATIVTHLIASEAETLRCVAGIACERDRDPEFSRSPQRLAETLSDLDAADRLIEELAPGINPHRLRAVFSLPTLPVDDRRTGLTWLVGNYGHAREHIGHIQLTKEVYLDIRSTP
jgi:hypothetical protein